MVSIRRGVVVGYADSGVMTRLDGVETWAEGVIGVICLLFLLWRICLDFLAEGTFFCVIRVLSVDVIVRVSVNL